MPRRKKISRPRERGRQPVSHPRDLYYPPRPSEIAAATALDSLTDVSLGTLADDDFFVYDTGSGAWVNRALALGDITEAMVTQHEAALSIAYSQLTGSPSFGSPLTVDADGAGDSFLILEGDAGDESGILLRSGSTNRWGIRRDSTAEVGSNAGSGFNVDGYADNGSYLGAYLTIERATGDADFPLGTLAWGGGGPIGSSDDVLANAALSDLTDVVISTPANREILTYDSVSGDWINRTAAEANLAASSHTHTTSDITNISDYAKRIQADTISGNWTFTGTPTFQGATTFTAKADIQANADIEGDLVLGDGSGHTFLYIDSDSSSVSRIEFREGTTRRWLVQKDGNGDLVWHGYNSSGTHLGQFMKMNQSAERIDVVMDGGLLIRTQSDGLLLWEDFSNSQSIVAATGTDDLILQADGNEVHIDDGGTNTARAASVKAITTSATTPTGDYPYGTLHLIY